MRQRAWSSTGCRAFLASVIKRISHTEAVDPAGQATIHVGNLPPLLTIESIEQFFAHFGQVREARLGSNGQYGFIEFVDAASAIARVEWIAGCRCG